MHFRRHHVNDSKFFRRNEPDLCKKLKGTRFVSVLQEKTGLIFLDVFHEIGYSFTE